MFALQAYPEADLSMPASCRCLRYLFEAADGSVVDVSEVRGHVAQDPSQHWRHGNERLSGNLRYTSKGRILCQNDRRPNLDFICANDDLHYSPDLLSAATSIMNWKSAISDA